jgi:hypothetical protein
MVENVQNFQVLLLRGRFIWRALDAAVQGFDLV